MNKEKTNAGNTFTPPKVLLFDFDGTLVNSLEPGLEGVNELAGKYGFKPLTDIDYLRKRGLKEVIRYDLGLRWYSFPFFFRDLKKILLPRIPVLELHPGIKNVLLELKHEYRLFILTSNLRPAVEYVLKTNTLEAVFEDVLPGSSLFSKDRTLYRFCKKYKLQKSDILYIGDEVRDLKACQKGQFPFVAVSWGFNDHSALKGQGAEIIVDHPDELLNLLRS